MRTTTYHMCLSLLSKCKTLKSVKQIQANFLKAGVGTDPFVAGKLILHCAVSISDSLHYAGRLLLHTPNPDAFMYNTVIRGLSESDKPQDSITTFIEMCRNSISHLDSFSFAFIFKAAANFRSLRVGIQLHCQALVHGLDTHLFVGTTLISMYAECGCVELSRKVFDEMHEPNVVAWNAILTAYFRGGDVENAARVFDQMPLRNLTSWNVTLAGYTKAAELELARKTFVDMPMKDDVSWSTMIVGFAHSGWFDEALGFYKELRKVGLRPNEVSLTGVLSVCAQAGALEFGKIIHGFIEKAGFIWLVSVNNALVDAYSRCGNVSMAQLVFERMPNRDAVSWTTIIAGLAMHGWAQEAIQLFNEMEKSGNTPDSITFVSILHACSHAGLIDEGYQFFLRIKDKYNIEPAIEHYGCVVDMYGRAGKLKEAYEFVCQMPISPNDIIWRTLLGACSIHCNVELAEKVKERLSELDPNNSGDYVLLSNTYAISGKWKDVATVRRSMNIQQIKKTPGWSMIKVDKILYSFAAGSRQNEIAAEAFAKLQEIMLRLRVEGGYMPEVQRVLYDIEEEEKEDSVSQHSEKLAVAFGMARLREGRKIIRIVKNLRVCRDCHTVMKLISKIYGLEIVVRDRSRFHSFRDGSCSCSDYW